MPELVLYGIRLLAPATLWNYICCSLPMRAKPLDSLDQWEWRWLVTDWPCSWAGCRSDKLGWRRSACRQPELPSGPPRCWSWRVWPPRLWARPALIKYQVSGGNIRITVRSSHYTGTFKLSWNNINNTIWIFQVVDIHCTDWWCSSNVLLFQFLFLPKLVFSISQN